MTSQRPENPHPVFELSDHLAEAISERGKTVLAERDFINHAPFEPAVDSEDPFDNALDFKGGGKGNKGTNGRNFEPEAQAQSDTTGESTTVSIDLLAGSHDKNGDPLVVTHLNGQSVAYNSWVTLSSGARVFLEPSGILVYDPSGSFDSLHSGETATETLTYTLSDGRGGVAESEVQIEIIGEDPQAFPPDAIDDTFVIDAGFATNLDVLTNDLDLAGGGLEIVAINGLDILPGEHVHLDSGVELVVDADGTILADAGSAAAFNDSVVEESFSYTVRDVNGQVDTAFASLELRESTNELPSPPDPTTDPTPYYVSALLAGDEYRLNAGETYGSSAIVKFAFADAPPEYYPSSSYVHDEFYAFTDQQREATLEILGEIAGTTGLTFVEASTQDAELIFGIANMGGDALGTAFYPSEDGTGTFASDVWIDSDVAGATFEPGTLGYTTLIHEIGHALGLSHPDYTQLSWIEETRQFTVMGYGEHPTATVDASSFMLYDIAALQHLYGENGSASAGDDIYQIGTEVRTIWDAGGRDALDVSSSNTGTVLNLNAGTFSSTGGQTNNLAIAFGTTIEEALGSSYDDAIFGNEADNWIDGGTGNDTLSGGDGADTYSIGSGWGHDRIEDYAVGEDKLDFSGTGLTLEDLLITAVDGDTMISDGENSLRLADIDGDETQLDEAFLLF